MFKMFNINFVKKLHSRGTSHPIFSTANCKRNYPSPFLKLQKLRPACIFYKVGRQLKNVQPRRNLPTTFWNEEIAFCKILFFQFVPGQRCSGKWGQKKKSCSQNLNVKLLRAACLFVLDVVSPRDLIYTVLQRDTFIKRSNF